MLIEGPARSIVKMRLRQIMRELAKIMLDNNISKIQVYPSGSTSTSIYATKNSVVYGGYACGEGGMFDEKDEKDA
jgi:hypothetical protein